MNLAQVLAFACILWGLEWPQSHVGSSVRDSSSSLASKRIANRVGIDQLGHEHMPFDPERMIREFGIDERECVWLELRPRDRLYRLGLKYVAEHSDGASFAPAQPKRAAARFSTLMSRAVGPFDGLQFGIGATSFGYRLGDAMHRVHVVHQGRGPVVGTSSDAALFYTLLLFVEGRSNQHVLSDLCRTFLEQELHPSKDEYSIYRFDAQRSTWTHEGVQRSRSTDSVILENTTKETVLGEFEDFVAPTTHAWYSAHGIPHKRCFLFHGAPGSGKTSLMQAAAARHGLSLCVLQADPALTDLKLTQAIRDAPPRSVLALEDVDALFPPAAAPRDGSGPPPSLVSYSGLLNALDGVANGDGRVFVLTTNHRDRLPPALLRPGRVDVEVEFRPASAEQLRAMFLRFYPGEAVLAARFEEHAAQALRGGACRVSMAAVQGFFIRQRKASAAEVASAAGRFFGDEVGRGEGAQPGQRGGGAAADAEERGTSAGGSFDGGHGGAVSLRAARRVNGEKEEAATGFAGPAVFVSTRMDPGWS